MPRSPAARHIGIAHEDAPGAAVEPLAGLPLVGARQPTVRGGEHGTPLAVRRRRNCEWSSRPRRPEFADRYADRVVAVRGETDGVARSCPDRTVDVEARASEEDLVASRAVGEHVARKDVKSAAPRPGDQEVVADRGSERK